MKSDRRENDSPGPGEPSQARRARGVSSFQEDQAIGRAFDPHLFRRLLRYALPYRGPMALAFVLILLVAIGGLVGPFLIREAIDGPIHDAALAIKDGAGLDASAHELAIKEPLRELLILTAVFLGISVVLLFLRFVQGLVMAWIGQRVMLDLRMEVFEHLIRMPFAFFDRNPVGRLVTRLTSDIEALNELFASGIVSFLADVLVLVGITVALVAVNAKLALVTLAIVPLLLLATFVFRSKARSFYREQRSHISHLTAFTQESIQGMSIVQAFHREDATQAEHETINHRYTGAFLRSVMAYSIYFPIVEILSTVALAAVVYFGAREITSSPPALTFGEFFLFWHFVGRFFQPIRDMAERYNILQSAMAAAERVFEVVDTPQTVVDPENPRPLSGFRGHIEFDHVSFAYASTARRRDRDASAASSGTPPGPADGELVLRDVSFVVEPGTTVAIVGATGAGKSTIISLLSRFYDPQRGSIRIDGVDLRDYRKSDVRRRIAVVLQDVFLFSRSVRENILLSTTSDADADGAHPIDDESLERHASSVHADRFISRLPRGYDTILAERGRTLSVGEKQLLVFARALAQDPDILILDEATAHIDSETEALIQDALGTLLVGRTSIVIAHRLSTIQRADKILVFHKGTLREEGRHAELLARGGIYRRLYELQYRDSPEG